MMRRKVPDREQQDNSTETSQPEPPPPPPPMPSSSDMRAIIEQQIHNTSLANAYWLTRMTLFKLLGFVFFFAFLISAFQNRALIGQYGIHPVSFPSRRPTPMFTWVFGWCDRALELVGWLGTFLSLLLCSNLCTHALLPFLLWSMYLSIVNLGSHFIMGYGWEWLLLEVTFPAILFAPLSSISLFTKRDAPSKIIIWIYRWMTFRVMLGAGLSKLGNYASDCWRDYSCLSTHYETQPNPNPMAWFSHHTPLWFHRWEGMMVLIEQVVLPWAIFVPHRLVHITVGLLEMFFQSMIIITGNYAYINWIAIVPVISLFDDKFLSWFYSAETVYNAKRAQYDSSQPNLTRPARTYQYIRRIGILSLLVLTGYKSIQPVQELMGPSPWLNYYDDYFIVNAHGVFGFINTVRYEMVLHYTHDEWDTTDATHADHIVWKPLHFKCLPGEVHRMPCVITPYHYRLDWEAWIYTTASLEHPSADKRKFVPDFMEIVIGKLLGGDTDQGSLMGVPLDELYLPIRDGQSPPRRTKPPTAIQAELKLYKFSNTSELFGKGVWWETKDVKYATPKIYTAKQHRWRGRISQIDPHRDWMLFGCVITSFLTILGFTRDFYVSSTSCLPALSSLRLSFSVVLLRGVALSCALFVFGVAWSLDATRWLDVREGKWNSQLHMGVIMLGALSVAVMVSQPTRSTILNAAVSLAVLYTGFACVPPSQMLPFKH